VNYLQGLPGAAACAAILTMALAGCGGNNSGSDTAQLRVVNATASHASIDLLVNSSTAIAATAKDAVSAYTTVASGGPTIQVDDAGATVALATLAPTLSKDQHYAVLVYESGTGVRTAVLGEDNTAPSAGTAALRIFDASPDAGSLDVYVTDPATDITTVSPTFTLSSPFSATQVTSFLTFPTGTVRVRVTGTGNASDLRLDIPSVALASQALITVLVTPSTGGVLTNGGALVQQGGYAATRNATARVRVAAAVTGNASVGATSGTTVVSTPTTSPAVGSYVVVPAGVALAVSVNGASVQVPGGGPQAGSDSTLLVYGSAAAPTVTVIADDNHLPSTTTAVRMRMVNGVTGSATPLTLAADFGVVAANVAPGAASPYGSVAANTAMRLEVTSPSGLAPVYTESALSIPAQTVFTLFMLGDAAAPSHVLRRDR
jgi:hypothetical protein